MILLCLRNRDRPLGLDAMHVHFSIPCATNFEDFTSQILPSHLNGRHAIRQRRASRPLFAPFVVVGSRCSGRLH